MVVTATVPMYRLLKPLNIYSRFALNHLSFSANMSEKNAVVLLSEGSEEMELIISVDVLRRAGINVTVAGVQGSKALECSRQVNIVPDLSLEEAISKGTYDVVVLPGGLKGSQTFCQSAIVGDLLKQQESSGRLIAAICAAPTALRAHEVCLGKKLTSYPGMESNIMEGQKYTYLQDQVVVDGNLITSRGPGTAFDFALAIVEHLLNKDKANEVARGLLLQ